MSASTVQCPQCFTRVPAPDKPGAVMCPGCEAEFTPASADPPPRKNPNVPLARPISAGKDKPDDKPATQPVTARRAKDDADDDRPGGSEGGATRSSRRTRSRRDDDEKDDRPRSRRRRYEDDDDDQPAKKGGSALPIILIVGGVLAVLTVGGAVAVGAALFMGGPSTATFAGPVAVAPQPQNEPPRGNWNDPDPFLEPKVQGPGDFPGGGPPVAGGGGLGGPMGGPGVVRGAPDPFNPQPEKPKVPKVAPKYADVTPVDIKPTKLAEDTGHVRLPGKVVDTCSGGGGRFFIAHLSDVRKLAIFDVTEAKVVKYVELAAGNVRFAAGMNKLIVAYPDQHTLVRYDLTTFEKEATEKCPADGTIKKVAMGSASAGPLLVALGPGKGPGGFVGQSQLEFVDPATFKAVDIRQENPQPWRTWQDNDQFRASPDGRVFAVHGPNGLTAFPIRGGSVKHVQPTETNGHLTPGPDGNLYAGNGLFTPDLKRIGRGGPHGTGPSLMPAAEGALYLQLTSTPAERFHGMEQWVGPKWKGEVKLTGDERTVYTFKELGEFITDAYAADSIPVDARVHFAPTAQLMVTLPIGNDRLVLRKFDLQKAFEESGVDYLYVASRPRTAVPGKGFEYQIEAKSKKGGVKCKLDAGPAGLTVSEAGKVSWSVPADFKEPEPVIVTVSDASGQEVFHTFELAPGDGKGFAGPVSGTAKAAARKDDKPDPKAGQGLVAAPDRVFEIKPPPLQERATVTLPGAADAVCVGGGGRFLIYRLGAKKQLAILDVTVGKVVKYLPLTDSDALFAAGMTKLFVFSKSAGVFLRYDLEKFEKELTAQNPLGGSPSVLLMGHASEGPLYVGGADVGTETKGYGFINIRTMKEQSVPLEGKGLHGQPVAGPTMGGNEWQTGRVAGIAVSPDGRTYAWTDANGGATTMTLGEKAARVVAHPPAQQWQWGLLRPGADGHLYGINGVYTPDLKKVGDGGKHMWGGRAPATSGPWYVALVEGEHGRSDPNQRRFYVGLAGEDRTRFPVPADGLPPTLDYWSLLRPAADAKVPLADRLHLAPEAEVLAVLDDGLEKVHLHRVPVKGMLEKSDADAMMVVSRPPPAVRGRKWTYTPEVWSKKGGVKVKVESGPDGMKADSGTVTWDVPAKFGDPDSAVILTVSDASGQESFHTFTLSVRGEPLPAVSVIKPAPPVADPTKPADPNKAAKAPPAFPLKPTAAKDGTDVALSGPADYACLAGGGRFLLLRIPSKKEVAVFDVVEGKVAKSIPLPEDGALVAGGRAFAVVVNPRAGVVQRWNLSTFEKDATAKLPDNFTPTAAVMGHASDGPLYLGGDRTATRASGFFDPLTLKRLDVKEPKTGQLGREFIPNPSPCTSDAVHASPDGRVWAWWSRNSTPNGLQSAVLRGDTATAHYSHVSMGAILVGAGGELFTGAGVFAGDQSAVLDAHSDKLSVRKVNSWTEISPPSGVGDIADYSRTPIPAADGPFYLWFPADDRLKPRWNQPKPTTPPGPERPPALKMIGQAEPLGELKDLRGLGELKDDRYYEAPDKKNPGPTMPFHQRAYLIAGAELLAIVSPDGTKVHLHTFKPRELMDKSGKDHLVVMGSPPPFAPPGTKWTYTPDVWSKKGGVKVEVVSGPGGLKAEGAGVVWEVPRDLLDNQVGVELKVSDASGKSVPVRFNLSLTDTPPTPVAPGGTAGGSGVLKKKDPKANSNALVTKHKDKLEVKASSDWGGSWPVTNLIDGEETTTWYSNTPDNTVSGSKPVVTLTFPVDVAVKRVTVLGTRDPSYPTGYTVTEGTLELLDKDGKVVAKHELKAAGEKSDFDLPLKAATTARAVRFTMTKSEHGSCALGEIMVE